MHVYKLVRLKVLCTSTYLLQIRQSVDITRPGTAGELLRQSVVPPQGLQPSQAQTGQVLDYAKIKADLTTATDRMRALLLQALRWVGIHAFSIHENRVTVTLFLI